MVNNTTIDFTGNPQPAQIMTNIRKPKTGKTTFFILLITVLLNTTALFVTYGSLGFLGIPALIVLLIINAVVWNRYAREYKNYTRSKLLLICIYSIAISALNISLLIALKTVIDGGKRCLVGCGNYGFGVFVQETVLFFIGLVLGNITSFAVIIMGKKNKN